MLSLEVFDNCSAHPHPPVVVQVEHVMDRLQLAPLVPLVGLEGDLGAILQELGGRPDSKPVEPRGNFIPLIIKVNNPVVEFLNLIVEIDMVGWGWPIVWEPDKLGGIEDGGNDQLVFGVWMVGILVSHHLLQVEKVLCNLDSGGTPDQVIQTCGDQDSHGPDLLSIVMEESILQIRNGATRDCQPVNVHWVSWTSNGGVPWVMDVVKLAGPQTHIQPIVWPDGVHGHAGGAHVGGVGGGELHPLHDAYLPG